MCVRSNVSNWTVQLVEVQYKRKHRCSHNKTRYDRQNTCVRTTPNCFPVFIKANISRIIYYIYLQTDMIWLCLTPTPQKLKMYCVVQSPLTAWRFWKLVSESFPNNIYRLLSLSFVYFTQNREDSRARVRACVCVCETIAVRNKTIIL
jgi:hypothetical protein